MNIQNNIIDPHSEDTVEDIFVSKEELKTDAEGMVGTKAVQKQEAEAKKRKQEEEEAKKKQEQEEAKKKQEEEEAKKK